jgi:hypothetical protein
LLAATEKISSTPSYSSKSQPLEYRRPQQSLPDDSGVWAYLHAPGVATGGTRYGGGEQTSYGIGLNWYPNLNMKFMLDYEHIVVDNPQVFGGPNYRGATIDWIAGRTQLVF